MSATNMPDTEVSAARPLTTLLDRIGSKWTILVMEALSTGPKRFNAMSRAIDGVSQRMLTLTLRNLEREGLIVRTVYPTNPPSVEYQYSDLGRDLAGPLRALAYWAQANLPRMDEAAARYHQGRDGEGPP